MESNFNQSPINSTLFEFGDRGHAESATALCCVATVSNYLHAIVGSIGFLLNIAVSLTIICTKRLRRNANSLLINFLISNAFYAGSATARAIFYLLTECPELSVSNTACLLRNIYIWAAVQISLFAAFSVTIGHFVAIKIPVWYRKWRREFVTALVLMPWLFGILLVGTAFTEFYFDPEQITCVSQYVAPTWHYYLYHYLKLIVLIPLFFCYFLMLDALRQWPSTPMQNFESNRIEPTNFFEPATRNRLVIAAEHAQAELCGTHLIVLIIGIYLALWICPFLLTLVVEAFTDVFMAHIINRMLWIFPVLTTLINVWVFVLKYPDIAESYRQKVSSFRSSVNSWSSRNGSILNASKSNRVHDVNMVNNQSSIPLALCRVHS